MRHEYMRQECVRQECVRQEERRELSMGVRNRKGLTSRRPRHGVSTGRERCPSHKGDRESFDDVDRAVRSAASPAGGLSRLRTCGLS